MWNGINKFIKEIKFDKAFELFYIYLEIEINNFKVLRKVIKWEGFVPTKHSCS